MYRDLLLVPPASSILWTGTTSLKASWYTYGLPGDVVHPKNPQLMHLRVPPAQRGRGWRICLTSLVARLNACPSLVGQSSFYVSFVEFFGGGVKGK